MFWILWLTFVPWFLMNFAELLGNQVPGNRDLLLNEVICLRLDVLRARSPRFSFSD